MTDKAILISFYNLTNFSPFFDGLIIFLGKTLPYLAFIYFLYLIYKVAQTSSIRAIKITLSSTISIALLSGIILPILHYLLVKARPFVELGLTPLFTPLRESTFPSGHASFFALLATIALLKISERSGIILYSLAVIISLSRVVAGLHWPSDILLGSAIGIAVPLIVEFFAKIFTTKQKPEP
jgi:membrane-associated phospholipid phosphatase